MGVADRLGPLPHLQQAIDHLRVVVVVARQLRVRVVHGHVVVARRGETLAGDLDRVRLPVPDPAHIGHPRGVGAGLLGEGRHRRRAVEDGVLGLDRDGRLVGLAGAHRRERLDHGPFGRAELDLVDALHEVDPRGRLPPPGLIGAHSGGRRAADGEVDRGGPFGRPVHDEVVVAGLHRRGVQVRPALAFERGPAADRRALAPVEYRPVLEAEARGRVRRRLALADRGQRDLVQGDVRVRQDGGTVLTGSDRQRVLTRGQLDEDLGAAAVLPPAPLVEREVGGVLDRPRRLVVDEERVPSGDARRAADDLEPVGAVVRDLHGPLGAGADLVERADVLAAGGEELPAVAALRVVRVHLRVGQRHVLGLDRCRPRLRGRRGLDVARLVRRDHELVGRVPVVGRHVELQGALLEFRAVVGGDDARRVGQALGAGQGDLTDLDVDAVAEDRLVQTAQIERDIVVRASPQDGGAAVLLVDRADALEGVDRVRLRRGHPHRLRAGEVAVPLEHPPAGVRAVRPGAVVGEVARVVPVGGLGVDLGVLEHREPLDELPRNAHVAQHAVLGDVHRDRLEAERRFERPVVGEVLPVVREVVDAELVPDEDVRQRAVLLSEGQVVGAALGLPAAVARPADPRVPEAVAVPDLLDLLVHGLPVGEELLLVLGPVRVPDPVGFVVGDEDVVLGAVGAGRDGLGDELDDFEVVPHAVGALGVGAVRQVVGAGVAGAHAAVVGPVRVVVLDVDVHVLAVLVEEAVFDCDRVAGRVLGTVGRLLGHVGDVGAVDQVLRRRALVAEAVERAGRAAAEVAGAVGEVHLEHLGLRSGGRWARRGGHGGRRDRRRAECGHQSPHRSVLSSLRHGRSTLDRRLTVSSFDIDFKTKLEIDFRSGYGFA